MPADEPTTDPRRTLYAGIAVAVLLAVSVAVAAARGGDATTAQTPPPSASAEATSSASSTPTATPDASASVPPTAPGTAPGTSPSPVTPPAKEGVTQTAKKGEKLVDLKAPPERTIGMIVIPEDFKSARFSITFSPYGWGPAGQNGGRLVAKVSKSQPLDPAAKALSRDFADRNVTLWCSKAISSKIKLGGSYSGVMEVRKSGDTGVLLITQVKTP